MYRVEKPRCFDPLRFSPASLDSSFHGNGRKTFPLGSFAFFFIQLVFVTLGAIGNQLVKNNTLVPLLVKIIHFSPYQNNAAGTSVSSCSTDFDTLSMIINHRVKVISNWRLAPFRNCQFVNCFLNRNKAPVQGCFLWGSVKVMISLEIRLLPLARGTTNLSPGDCERGKAE